VTRYPCWNHPPHGGDFGPVLMQDGWTSDNRRRMREVHTLWQPVECGHYPTPGPDPRCHGCRWRNDA